MKRDALLPYVAVLAFGCPSIVYAQQSPNQGLLGDWGGLRTRLYERGIDFQLGYTVELAYNSQGGDANLLRYADQVAVATTLDLERLLGWSDAKFQITLTDRNGQNLSDEANLGTLMQVQEIFGRGHSWRWTQFWYEQAFLDNQLDVKAGRLGVGEDFMSFSCEFQNLSFCGSLPGNIVSTWFNWPVSQWAARLKVSFAPDWDIKVGAYQINPDNLDPHLGLQLGNIEHGTGTLLPAELGWSSKLGAAQLPGSYRVGAWYDSSNQSSVSVAADGSALALSPGAAPRIESNQAGLYVMLQQQVTAPGGDVSRGLTLFANFVQADRDTATIDQLIIAGAFYVGPFPGRPQDDVGFAIGRTHVNSRVADGQELQNTAGLGPVTVQHSEYPYELYYTFQVGNWLSLRPNLQYIHRPGGTDQNDDVVVIGLKAGVKL
jgi:porin